MTKNIIKFFVPGDPATAGSKVSGMTKRGKRFYRPASKFTKSWMDTVRKFAMEGYSGPLLTGAISLSIVFCFVRPKSHYGTGKNKNIVRKSAPLHPTSKDLSKCIRSVEDALTGIIYRDDSQIYRYIEPTGKTYGPKAGADIRIEEDLEK